MSLDQLHAVVTIADTGTLVRAARRLHISQPPLTRKLLALEEELGVRLFARNARGMTLTPAGEAFAGEAMAILAAVARAAAIARRGQAEPPAQVGDVERELVPARGGTASDRPTA